MRSSRTTVVHHAWVEYPPSTVIAAPLMKSDSRLARNAAMPRKSSGWPQRPAGVRLSSVSIYPGGTAFAWMLSLPQAEAHALVNCTMPPLLAAKASEAGARSQSAVRTTRRRFETNSRTEPR